jgi:hypothetical protein
MSPLRIQVGFNKPNETQPNHSLTWLERLFDIVQSCDKTQVRSDSVFGVKFSTVYFYAIEHNVKFNSWIELKLGEDSKDILQCWGKFWGESEFRKDLQYRSE